MQKIMSFCCAAAIAGAPAFALAQADTRSQKLGTDLAKRLADREGNALAAAVPDDPSRFVAALHIPGVQLLVISARYQVPALLHQRIVKNEHRQVYMELHAAGERAGRFFVEDLGADGLRPDRERDRPFDITWREGVTRTLYNGGWTAQKLSEAEYRARFEKDDAEYARMLEILTAAGTTQSTSSDAMGSAGRDLYDYFRAPAICPRRRGGECGTRAHHIGGREPASGDTEQVTVTAEKASALATPSGGMNFTYEEVDAHGSTS